MAFEKHYTAKQAAELVLKKAHELLEKNELTKAEKSKHDRCVEHVKENSPGVSNAHAVCVAEGVKPASWGKAETGHEKGVHTHNHEGEGRSAAGSFASAAVKGNTSLPKEALNAAAKEQHAKVLGEMQSMPKPALGKSESPMPKPHLPHEGMMKLGSKDHDTLKAHHESEAKKQFDAGNWDHGLSHQKMAQVHDHYGAAKKYQEGQHGYRSGGKAMAEHWTGKAKEAMEHHFGKCEMAKSELAKYESQNPKKENAKPSEHNSKSAEQPGNGPAPKGEIHPKEKAQGASDDVRRTQNPGSNPKEQAEGNNELAGTTPTQVGQDGKNVPGGDEIKGHLKLAKFIGHMEAKRKMRGSEMQKYESDMSGGQKRGPSGYPKYQEQAQDQKGIHTPVSGVTQFPGGKGTSQAGSYTKDRYAGKPTFSGKDHPAKEEHKRVLGEMKDMPKPKLPE